MTARCRPHPRCAVRPVHGSARWTVVVPAAILFTVLLLSGGRAPAHATPGDDTVATILAELGLPSGW